MATETLSALGTNSAVIDYSSNAAPGTVLSLTASFLAAHGWEYIPSFTQGSTAGAEQARYAFRSLLLDGVNYKYMYICYNSTYATYDVFTATNITGSTTTLTVTNKSYVPANSVEQQYTWAGPGKFYLFATNRFFAFIHYGANAANYGSNPGNGLTGVFEVEPANLADPQKIYSTVWLNTYKLTGLAVNSPFYYGQVVTPPITRLYTGVGASNTTKITTPIGEWGLKCTTNIGDLMSKAIPAATSLFNPGKHQIHEMTLVYDTESAPYHYVKGRLCGIKTFTLGTGVNGDIFKVLCDDNHFLDPAGTLKDFYIIRHTTLGSFGIPM